MPFSVVKWLSVGAEAGPGSLMKFRGPAKAARTVTGQRRGAGRRDRSTSFSLFHLMLTAPSF